MSFVKKKPLIVVQEKKKTKLKKKWRFWRAFRRYFLSKKKKTFFLKLRWSFSQRRAVSKHFLSLYGKSLSKFLSRVHKGSNICKRFVNLIPLLELKFDILLLRTKFASTVEESRLLIQNGNALINGVKKNPNYLVKVNDVFEKAYLINSIRSVYFFSFLRRWRRYKWRIWYRLHKKKFERYRKHQYSLIGLKKKNLIFNYLETNYRIFSGIVLRRPLIGEILLGNKNKILKRSLLKKLYFLY